MTRDDLDQRQQCDVFDWKRLSGELHTQSTEGLRFWSGSWRKVASLVTQVLARVSPEWGCNIPPTMHVWTHS